MSQGHLILDGDVCIPPHIYGLEGFVEWAHSPGFPPRGRFAFLDGEVDAEMSPEEFQTHNFVKADMGRDLGVWVVRHDLGRVFSGRALLVNDAAGLSTEPDLTLCTWKTLEQQQARFVERVAGSGRFVELNGSPDLVVEVVSDSSVVKDTRELPVLYFCAGVAEYWLIDARGEEIDFPLQVRGADEFVAVAPDADGYVRSGILDGSFLLTRQIRPVGGFQYTLHAK